MSYLFVPWYARNEACFEGRNLETVNIVQKTWIIIED